MSQSSIRHRRPRIQFVSLHTSPVAVPGQGDAGGMNVYELNAALALGRAGFCVDLVTRRADPDSPALSPVGEGVRLIQLDAGEPAPVAKSDQERLIEPFRAALATLPAPDLVHSHHWFSGVAALPVAASWGVPHVASFHSIAAPPDSSLDLGEPPESPGRNAGERLVAAGCDRVVAVSRYESEVVRERLGAPGERVTVVRPGVDTELFRPLAPGEAAWRPEGVPAERPLVVFSARLQPLKAPDLAIRALAGLPAGVDAHLVIAGQASRDFAGYAEQLAALAGQLGVTRRVSFLDSQRREELAGLLRSARVVIVPSFSETFGMLALEAQASGVPVLASRAGGLPEAVVGGVLVEGRDPARWSHDLAGLLSQDAWHQQLASSGRSFAEGRTWSVVAAELAEAYAGLGVTRPDLDPECVHALG